MAVNTELVGKQYPSHTYEVAREKIREFASAIGDHNAAYFDVDVARALGHDDLVAPPTFSVVVTRAPQIDVINDPELGLDFSRVVHGDQSFQFTRPIVAGETLHATASVASARSVAGNDIVAIRTDITDDSAAPVATVTATLVARAGDDK